MIWRKFLKHPFSYYRIYNRKEKIRLIRIDRLWRESALGMWANKRIIEMPLLNMFVNQKGISLYQSNDRFIYTCEIEPKTFYGKI